MDEEVFKINQKMDNATETLQDSDDQVAELQEQVVGFENSIADLTREIQCLNLQKDGVTTQINNIRNLVPPILEIKDKASFQLGDLIRRRKDHSSIAMVGH